MKNKHFSGLTMKTAWGQVKQLATLATHWPIQTNPKELNALFFCWRWRWKWLRNEPPLRLEHALYRLGTRKKIAALKDKSLWAKAQASISIDPSYCKSHPFCSVLQLQLSKLSTGAPGQLSASLLPVRSVLGSSLLKRKSNFKDG